MWLDYFKADIDYLVGVDEAGRGPLAGPLALGAVVFPRSGIEALRLALADYPAGKDSKKLSPRAREIWRSRILSLKVAGHLNFAVTFVSPKFIDDYGMTRALTYGLAKNLKKLNLDPTRTELLLDGSLRGPVEYSKQRTIIKGDESELIIGLASIVAKVTRDNYLSKIAKLYPLYNFEQHKGYGTKAHCEALRRYGPCPIHRRSFLHRILS
ncbi:MAG: ribonuclease HII [Candidatus Vogelbacteria bacterium CG22_combo_CG10-13_8_21_14_all_37_9]|uniref:Ribonuclease n=1 Tax=Candidatus Vogelbacteria bacterium CG22_combo_CG10-13_8_21_14_all_37_9 TaxID=1975046 RepID=A0A2H0BLQ0_9BACT|nr:MAG: ribonuclease HII [Candidatus Vogelbacteria bacterium CG22_combo_CG10-13_8_21_14_all_37_9]